MLNSSGLATLTLFLAALPCAAQVKDDANLFSAETKRQAAARIRQIREQTGKEVAVWTLKEVPPELAKDVNLGDAGQRKEVFEKLAEEHIKKLHLEGVHLLICQEPQH